MKIYLVGIIGAHPKESPNFMTLFKKSHKLHSYYYIWQLEKHWWKMNTENKIKLFLDSGAFSAWSQGLEINIDEYIEFIKQNEKIIHVYANLDVIGLGGNQPNELTAKATLENQKIMEAAGLNPMPVFHFGEPFSYLQYYVEHYEYLALGIAGNSPTSLVPWLDVCFKDYICDANGFPKIKVHGFAVTAFELMRRYPWYSVDSTSWVITGRNGSVFIPIYRDREFQHRLSPMKVEFSNRSGKKLHYQSLPKILKSHVDTYLHEKGFKVGHSEFKMVTQDYELQENEKFLGAKPKNPETKRKVEIYVEDGLSNRYQLRDELNIIYYQDLEASFPPYPTKFIIPENPMMI